MITFFTIPRPFTNLHQTIQSNAILSWKKIYPRCEILVFSDHSTIAEFCKKNKIEFIENFKCNSYGTPLLSDIWSIVKKRSSSDLICYINTDIILFSNFLDRVKSVNFNEFLLAGRRWDLNITDHIDFNSNWEPQLKKLINEKGVLHAKTGVDYFLFPKNNMPEMPPFAIGRAWWDNWLLTYFLNKKIPLIDGTSITTVHQNHDYNHIKSTNNKTTNKGIERNQNEAIANLKNWQIKDISDCTHILNKDEIFQVPIKRKIYRTFNRYLFGFLSFIKKKIKVLIRF
tara:strand:+ start:128 stop:982 length:855 start_codon:yes stop_codon:yes gene_type:complete